MQIGVARCPAAAQLKGTLAPCARPCATACRPPARPPQPLLKARQPQLQSPLARRLHPVVHARGQTGVSGGDSDDVYDKEELQEAEEANVYEEYEEEGELLDAMEGQGRSGNTGDAGSPGTSSQPQQYSDDAAYDDDEFDVSTETAEGEEGEEGEEGGKQQLPEPPPRSWYLPDLFAKAAELPIAHELDEEFKDLAVFGIEDMAEAVVEGDLYVCIDTVDRDGHDDVETAIANGAVAVVAEHEVEGVLEGVPLIITEDTEELAARLAVAFYDAPSLDLRTVGVVGSSGKTTVSWLVREVLEEAGQLTGMVGSIEHAVGSERMTPEGDIWEPDEPDPTEKRDCAAPFKLAPWRGKYSIEETTPDGLRLQKLLAGMRDRGATAAVVELESNAIAMDFDEYLEFDVMVFTNSHEDPLMDECIGAEGAAHAAVLDLFEDKLKDAETQRVVVNKDDEAAADIIAAASPVPAITYAINDSSAEVWAESLDFGIWETQMLVRTPLGRLEIITPLLGRHNVYNVLAAVATGVVLGVPLEAIGAGIEALDAIPGRSEVIDEGTPFSVIVDAANTPQRLQAILDGVRQSGARRVFTVMSVDGWEGVALRPKMGGIAHASSDILILTNGSPRTEDPSGIISDLVAGFPDDVVAQYSGYVYFPFQDQGNVPLWFEPYLQKAQRDTRRYIMEDRFSAIRAAIGTAQANDVVVIIGKGHTDWVEHWNGIEGDDGTVRGWLDDRVEARSALSKLQYLYAITGLERKELPWGNTLETMSSV